MKTLTALAALAVLIFAVPADAGYRTECDWLGHCYKVRTYSPPSRHYRKPRRPRYDRDDDDYVVLERDYRRGYRTRDYDGSDRRPICAPGIVEATGSEHTTADNSMDAVRKQWEWTAQWRYGSDYMDFNNAVEKLEGCGKSNAMDTVTNRVNEAVSSALGKDGFNQRCVLKARPCRVPLKPADGGPYEER